MNGRAATLIAICSVMALSAAHGQHDTSYYTSYAARRVTARFYFSQKYTALTLKNPQRNTSIRYQPNTTLNMGVGASYKWFTLNLAYGWGFLNQESDRGKTRYVDLQFHGYGEKFNVDFAGQFYKGFYLSQKGALRPGQYYVRPDLRINAIGISYQYIFNHRRFSFRAATLQTEWQKKSAGTPLLGIEIYGGTIRADSAMMPAGLRSEITELEERRISFFEMGPNAGYAYTWIIDRHFFFTGSAAVGLDVGFSTNTTSESGYKVGLIPNALFRANIGYNSPWWAFSIVYVNNGVNLAGRTNQRQATLNVGNIRFNLVHRFVPSRKQKAALEEVIK